MSESKQFLHRCLNPRCEVTEFTAADPVCPGCGAENPLVVRLPVIHFDPPSPFAGKGLGHRACDPTTPISRGRGTGEPAVVNCPACRATDAFRAVPAAGTGEDEALADVPAGQRATGVEFAVDAAGKVVKG